MNDNDFKALGRVRDSIGCVDDYIRGVARVINDTTSRGHLAAELFVEAGILEAAASEITRVLDSVGATQPQQAALTSNKPDTPVDTTNTSQAVADQLHIVQSPLKAIVDAYTALADMRDAYLQRQRACLIQADVIAHDLDSVAAHLLALATAYKAITGTEIKLATDAG